MTNKQERRFYKLVHHLAHLMAIRAMCREIDFPIKPASKAEKALHRKEMNELRSFVPKKDQPKLKLLLRQYAEETWKVQLSK